VALEDSVVVTKWLLLQMSSLSKPKYTRFLSFYRCIISTSFADIFFNNCFKNGMLPITLPKETVEKIKTNNSK
jgi:hypothetical protein